MKIVMFSSMPILSSDGSPIRGRTLARGLRWLGHDIAYVSHRQGIVSEQQLEQEEDAKFVDFAHHASIDAALEYALNAHAPDHVLAVTYGLVDVLSRVCLRRGVPFSVDLHGLRMLELVDEPMPLKEKLLGMRTSVRWYRALKAARYVLVANPKLYELLKRTANRTVPLIGMVDTDVFRPPAEASMWTDSPPRLLYCGNLQRYQGIGILLDALEKHETQRQPFELHVVGDGFDCKILERRFRRLVDLGRINWVGRASYAQIPDLARQFRYFVIPRPWSLTSYYAYPQKIVDMSSAGMCILASDIAPHRYALDGGRLGVLFKPTADGLLSALESLSPERVRSMQQGVREHAVRHYNYRSQAHTVEQLLAARST